MNKKTVINTVAACLLLGGIALAATRFYNPEYEETDDAQVEQYVSPINIKVAGYIREIRFTEHQHVSKGDTLAVIDNREYLIALHQAEASLMDARSGRKVAEGSLNTASSNASVFDSSIREAELRVEKLEHDYERYSKLLEKKATTPVVVEQYKTELDMARLNLSYTVVTAPADGFVGRRTIENGQLAGPGQTITTLIPDTRKWITANFKETQMSRIRKGQEVEISIDALPGKTFRGRVAAISSATGSRYSMVPTDNSAGNFVKIQQRIPVRIDLTDDMSADLNSRMAAGMMCEVRVNVKGN